MISHCHHIRNTHLEFLEDTKQMKAIISGAGSRQMLEEDKQHSEAINVEMAMEIKVVSGIFHALVIS